MELSLSKEELEKILDQKIDRVIKESDERMERYLGVIKEDNDDKLQAIFEYVQDIPSMKEKIDLMFDKIGELAENDSLHTETIKDHEVRITALEGK